MIPGSANPLLLASAAAAGGYQVQRSLRFNSSDSGFCSRTPGTAGNRKTWTWAGWVKLGTNFGGRRMLFGGGNIANSIPNTYLEITDSAQLGIDSVDPPSLSLALRVRTTAVLRDPSAWYHIVFSIDTTQATAANRIKIYINGVEQTSYSSTTYPSQNYDSGINSTQIQTIGAYPEAAYRSGFYFDGYLADIHFIDGQALTPSSFTEVSATTGQLIPKTYSGTFGTNGFWLKFSDNSAATAAALGNDYSGNNNDWTPNNLSVTAGAGNDSLVDTPTSFGTDTSVGGEVRGNYATLNPLDSKLNDNGTISNGNLQYAQSSTGARTGRASIGVLSGKWYWELTADNSGNSNVGVTNSLSNLGTYIGADANGWGYVASGSKSNNGETAYGSSWTSGDIIGVALNMDAGTITFYKNNVSQGTAFSGLSGTLFPSVGTSNISTCSFTINFGQRAFAYPLSGFKALCDTNLPAPVVAKPNTLMDVALYTGNGGTQTISGLNFSPDLVWIKNRSGANNHGLFDTIRLATKQLNSNTTDAESTDVDKLTAFTSAGFTVGNSPGTNASSNAYVGWAWDAGTSTVSNPDGSITSQVRANASAGFSVVSWTAGSAPVTIGHGLGVAPQFIIMKSRTSGAVGWQVGHASLGWTKRLFFDTAASDTTIAAWNDTAPTSTVFTVGSTGYQTGNMIAYCWTPVVGYSSMGSYVGNGSSDGPFVYTGMRPRWILVKRTDSADDWPLMDTARTPNNPQNLQLWPNFSNAESTITNRAWDALSNGFKLRGDNFATNASGGTYIYIAFAENPFQYARAR